jgi:hypothetical protein
MSELSDALYRVREILDHLQGESVGKAQLRRDLKAAQPILRRLNGVFTRMVMGARNGSTNPRVARPRR